MKIPVLGFAISFVFQLCANDRICLAGRFQNDREVAASAWNFLRSDKASQAVARQACYILDSLPHVKYRLDDPIAAGTPSDQRAGCAFVEASTWPDRVANKDDIDHDEDRPTWHRIAIPLNLDDLRGQEPTTKLELNGKKLLTLATDKKSTLNLVQALELNEAILRDEASPRDRRAIALCWLLNLMAEIQQPPNVSSLFSKDFPNGDDCGTHYMISDHGQVRDWHSLWDSLGNPESTSLETLNRHLVPLGRRRAVPGPEKSLDFTELALHTHNYDKNIREGGFPGGVNATAVKNGSKKPSDLPEGFFDGAKANIQKDLDLGGYHLATKLREILG